jgi:hypothetical protein
MSRRPDLCTCRSTFSFLFLLLPALLAALAAPAAATNAGCCTYKEKDGTQTCTTTSQVICRRLQGKNGGEFLLKKICDVSGATPKCIDGVACLACSGGGDAGELCDTAVDCAGLCVADCPVAGCVTLDELSLADFDQDTVNDFVDNCPRDSNADQADADGDGFGDLCPPCQRPATGDTVRPACNLVARRPGPPEEIDVLAQDLGSGIVGIDLRIGDNAGVAVPLFSYPTGDPLLVTATKLDPGQPSRVELRVVDQAGNCRICDPVLTTLVRRPGGLVDEVHTGLPASDDTVRVDNGAPGLRRLDITVNGRLFRLDGLRPRTTRILDISAALLPGRRNEVVLRAYGRLGSSASVMIWDGR